MASPRSRDERGQVIVIFALALVALVAMVGLVLDGGSAFAQRRSEQNAVDLAALAAANDLIVNQGSADWVGTARAVAKENGYEHGRQRRHRERHLQQLPRPGGRHVRARRPGHRRHHGQPPERLRRRGRHADLGRQRHRHIPDRLAGHRRLRRVRSSSPRRHSTRRARRRPAATRTTSARWSTPSEDTPTEAHEFAWTDFAYDKKCDETGNVDDQDLQAYMDSSATFELSLDFGCYIAQHNNGVMNNITARLAALAPITFPVPIVDESGNYVGWASFVLTSADPNGRNGSLTGYFETGNFQNQRLEVQLAGLRHLDVRRDLHPEADQLTIGRAALRHDGRARARPFRCLVRQRMPVS